MDRIFVPLYRFFRKHQLLMYSLVVASTVVFAYFGMKVVYEEDISKLLPSTESSADMQLAFGNLKVKDKIFIQFQPSDSVGKEELIAVCDAFFDTLAVRDSGTRYVGNVLYKVDDDVFVMGVDFAMSHVPSFVDTSCYRLFDESMTAEAADSQMIENAELIMDDMTGSATTMVCTDPFALRNSLVSGLGGMQGNMTGYSLIDNHLFCKDSTVALGFISPDFSAFDSGAGTHLVNMISDEISEFASTHPGVRILMHGAPVRSASNSARIKGDLLLTIGISLIVILIFLCIAFKSLSLVAFMVLPVTYGALAALAVIYWIQGGMSIMALGIGAIVLGVALSYCLHVLTHYKYVQDAEVMLKEESTPVCLGCITTIGAFMGLMFTKSSLLRDFGLFATIGLVGSTLFSLVILPHLLTLGKRGEKRSEFIFSAVDKIDSYPLDRKVWLNVLIGIVCIVCIFMSPKVEFDSDLKNIGYNTPELLESERLFSEKNYCGNDQVYYAATGNTLDEALAANAAILEVADSLEKAGIVRQYSRSTGMLFPTTEIQESRISAWKSYWSPEKVAEAHKIVEKSAVKAGLEPSSFGMFFDMIESDYAPESLYDSGLIPEGLLCNLIEKSDDGKYLVFTPVQMLPEDRRRVSDAISAVPNSLVVDPFYYTTDMVEVLHDDFNVVLWISSLFVLLVLLVSFRNVWSSLLAFMPMFLSWFAVEGIMAMFGLKFNLINIVISTFIFGIGVDYSIFVMEGLLDEARTGSSKLLTCHKAAIFFSAFVLMVVTVALIFARHPAISSIGVCTCVGMVSTILITYTLQPFLFRLMLKKEYFIRSMTGTKDKRQQ